MRSVGRREVRVEEEQFIIVPLCVGGGGGSILTYCRVIGTARLQGP